MLSLGTAVYCHSGYCSCYCLSAFLHPVHDEMLQTRFLHHLLPLAKEPAEAGESAAVQQLRAQLKDLNEHGPYFLPWCVMPLAKQPDFYSPRVL